MNRHIPLPDRLRSATELACCIRSGTMTSRQLLEAYLERIATVNDSLHAVVTLDAERARKRADELDTLARRGVIVGPLHGLPITIKDTLETEGIRTTAGARELADHVPAASAVAVRRVIDAGAVVFGKTNVPKFAADLQSYNELFGVSCNPWDATRTPGGSSGGAASAVASGLTSFEIGSDIGGSIRTPAHFCGIYGIKPTYGIVPLTGHIPGPPGQLAQTDIAAIGPLARSAVDLDLVLGVLAGPDDVTARASTFQLPPPRRHHISHCRVGIWLEDPAFPVDHAVTEGVQRLARALAAKGVAVEYDARPAFSIVEAADIYLQLLLPIFADGGGCLPTIDANAPITERWQTYPGLSQKQWLAANEGRHRLMAAWEAFFSRFDLLLCPPNPVTAIAHDHSLPVCERKIIVNGQPQPYIEQFVWVGALAGVAQLPAAVVPVGLATNGMPTGVQIIGPRYADRTVLHFATQIEAELFPCEPPPIAMS